MTIKHDKVGELNPCDDNKMIVQVPAALRLYIHTTVLSAIDFYTL